MGPWGAAAECWKDPDLNEDLGAVRCPRRCGLNRAKEKEKMSWQSVAISGKRVASSDRHVLTELGVSAPLLLGDRLQWTLGVP